MFYRIVTHLLNTCLNYKIKKVRINENVYQPYISSSTNSDYGGRIPNERQLMEII
jgi:hypothetical protein